jgi:hypothetical protein
LHVFGLVSASFGFASIYIHKEVRVVVMFEESCPDWLGLVSTLAGFNRVFL